MRIIIVKEEILISIIKKYIYFPNNIINYQDNNNENLSERIHSDGFSIDERVVFNR